MGKEKENKTVFKYIYEDKKWNKKIGMKLIN